MGKERREKGDREGERKRTVRRKLQIFSHRYYKLALGRQGASAIIINAKIKFPGTNIKGL